MDFPLLSDLLVDNEMEMVRLMGRSVTASLQSQANLCSSAVFAILLSKSQAMSSMSFQTGIVSGTLSMSPTISMCAALLDEDLLDGSAAPKVVPGLRLYASDQCFFVLGRCLAIAEVTLCRLNACSRSHYSTLTMPDHGRLTMHSQCYK